ncbi:MAG TPA: ComEA family DNA-binding protein [Candidatus Saccharicenans sp.]|jgi:comEA protein|nr:ComEA family DNA-binding protein [Candidatus Saccharicenans sp.]
MKTFFSKALAMNLAILVFFSLIGTGLVQAQNQSKSAPGKVNINTASLAELESLPRIGPKVAQRILDYRTQNGPFKKVEDLMKVQGIGEKIFNQLKDRITVGEPK